MTASESPQHVSDMKSGPLGPGRFSITLQKGLSRKLCKSPSQRQKTAHDCEVSIAYFSGASKATSKCCPGFESGNPLWTQQKAKRS
jgi:hypothetical protein